MGKCKYPITCPYCKKQFDIFNPASKPKIIIYGELKKKIIGLYEDGYSIERVARMTGVSSTVVRSRLMEWKVRIRNRYEFYKMKT